MGITLLICSVECSSLIVDNYQVCHVPVSLRIDSRMNTNQLIMMIVQMLKSQLSVYAIMSCHYNEIYGTPFQMIIPFCVSLTDTHSLTPYSTLCILKQNWTDMYKLPKIKYSTTWISNHTPIKCEMKLLIHSQLWVWGWISSFIPHLMMDIITCWDTC